MGYTHGTEKFWTYSEVVCMDTVSCTNSDKRPLLSISGRDSFGKMFIILRAFLPNEMTWVFQKIFRIVLPTLFPLYLLSQVKDIIIDGRPQEFMQIDIAKETHFKNILRMRCGSHLVRPIMLLRRNTTHYQLDWFIINFVTIWKPQSIHGWEDSAKHEKSSWL